MTNNKIGDVLHLYLGCDVIVPDEKIHCKMVAVNHEGIFIDSGCDYPFELVKPVLRPLSDMTEEEYAELARVGNEYVFKDLAEESYVGKQYLKCGQFWPSQVQWLLKNGFDLFDLIPSGLAINKTINPSSK